MKKAAIILLFLLAVLSLGAENFVVERYDIAITVSEDSSMHIKETILADFTAESHGIYRDIQYRFSNPDGNFADPVIAEVTAFECEDLSKEEKEDGYYRFYLGDEDEYITGEKEYVIEYDYTLGRDLYPDYDELYYNIISPAWDTPIWNITWSVTFPKKIDSKRIWVTLGEDDSTKKGTFTLSQDGKTVSGEQSGLMNYGALTLRVEMDEGYWQGIPVRSDNSTVYLKVSVVLSLVLLALSVVLWFLFGRDKAYSPVPSSDIPDSLTPMETRYILEDGKADTEKDLSAMLLYWADLGCVKIVKEECSEKDKGEGYRVIRLTGLPEKCQEAERNLFSLVFPEEKNSVTFYDIVDSGYEDKYSSEVLKKMNVKFQKGEKTIKRKLSSALETVLLISFLLLSIADGILMTLKFPGVLTFIFSLLLVILYTTSAVIGNLYQGRKETWSPKRRKGEIIAVAAVTLFVAGALIFLSSITLLNRPWITLSVIASVLSISLGAFISSHVEQRTEYGHDIYERCLALSRYLGEEGEKKDTEEQFTHLLPYAVALSKDSKWAENHKTLNYPSPSWFENRDHVFDDDSFLFWVMLRDSMRSSYRAGISEYAATHSSSSGSSGSSGGGFSGGGGGSW